MPFNPGVNHLFLRFVNEVNCLLMNLRNSLWGDGTMSMSFSGSSGATVHVVGLRVARRASGSVRRQSGSTLPARSPDSLRAIDSYARPVARFVFPTSRTSQSVTKGCSSGTGYSVEALFSRVVRANSKQPAGNTTSPENNNKQARRKEP